MFLHIETVFKVSWRCLLAYIYTICFFLSLYAQLQSTMPGVHTMPCATSLNSIRYVERCPRNSLEWDVRADVLNCSSISQTCVSTDMFRYHCVLNADGTNLLELCAPYKYIYGKDFASQYSCPVTPPDMGVRKLLIFKVVHFKMPFQSVMAIPVIIFNKCKY